MVLVGAALLPPNALAEDFTAGAVSAAAHLAAAAIQTPAGFSATAVASEPQLANPVAFCFDSRGRIFVAETYRVGRGVEDNRNHADWVDDDLAAHTVADRRAYTVRHMGERIGEFTAASDLARLVEDTDGDGLYDRSSVFSEGYNDVADGAAAGALAIDDRLLFACIPALWELRDADGDGKAEHRRTLAAGFGVHFALFGHDLHGLCLGPDGLVYFSIGDRGLHVDTPHGTLSNPDSGAVLRCRPDGSGLELFATGLRNPQELAFNELGDLFTVDNNSDSGDQARLVHVVEGMDAGWRMSYQYLPDRGPFNREKIWHTQNDSQPASIVPPLAHITAGPSGVAAYPGTGMPSQFDGSLVVCDFRGSSTHSGVLQFWVAANGATYRLAESRMLAEGVLATDCEFGPDGQLYISDWVNGWNGTGTGRIHRVATELPAALAAGKATQELLARLPSTRAAELPALLGHADMRVRAAAARRLVAAGQGSAAPLMKLAADPQSPTLARLHAVWALGQLAEGDVALFDGMIPLLADGDAEVRAQAAKVLGAAADADLPRRQTLSAALRPLLADDAPRAKMFAAIALGKLRCEQSLAGLLQLARASAEGDPVLRHAAAMGLAGSQTSAALRAAATAASPAERLAVVVALGRQRSDLVAEFLQDTDQRVRLEAARVIWDTPLPAVYDKLAAVLDTSHDCEPLLRRALAANQALGMTAHLEAVIRCGLRPEAPQPMRDHAWSLVRAWSTPSPRDPVHGQWRPHAARPAEEVRATLVRVMPTLVDGGESGAAGLVVAAELGVERAYGPLLQVVERSAHAPELRARALSALSAADESTVERVIAAGEKSADAIVQSAARDLLSRRFPARAVDVLAAVVESGEMRQRQQAIDALARIDLPAAREILAAWLTRVERGSCPDALVLDVLESAGASSDASLVERRAAYAQRLGAGVDAYRSCLEGGDAERGLRIFEDNATLSCRRCHSRTPGEQLVGPSLADVGLRRSRRELLESIVTPNAKIAEGFETTAMLLDTGQVVAGIVRREDDAHVTLLDAEGKEIVVELAGVENRSPGLSAMPDGLANQMTPRELRDVLEYLASLRASPGDAAPNTAEHGDSAPHEAGQ